jgi:hypothetical protein
MSEAGLLAAKPGYQWRPGKLCSERKRGARSMGPAGGRRLGPATRVRSWWTARDKGPGPLDLNLGCQGRNERATGGACESARRARVRLRTPARVNSSGHRATLRGGEAGSGWRRSTNCVTTQGRRCRQRLFGAVVDGNAWNLGRWLGRKRGAGRGGRKGESLKLGDGVFQRMLVTTSRLQRLVRDIFSRKNGGASAASGRRE